MPSQITVLTGGSQNLKPLSSWVVASSGKLATLLLSEATISNHCPHGWLLIASSNPLVSSATTSNHCPHGWLLIIASSNPLVSSATTSNQSSWVVTGHLHTHMHVPLCWFLAPQAPNKQESVSLTPAFLSLFHASDPLETDNVPYSMREVHGTVQHY